MLNLSFLFVDILLEGWSFGSRQTKSCEARYEQDNKSCLSYSFASGPRSEYSNHSWSTLAGSSCNRLQMAYQKFDHPLEKKPQDHYKIWEGSEWVGLGTRRNNDRVSCFSVVFGGWMVVHSWAHFAAHSI